jgi:ubiquinone/menaquinone biosynthesis C-methylase UbiE
MSLRGRYVIDRIKRVVSGSLRLPVPPYGDPFYWDAAYRSFGPQDCYEWGDLNLEDISPSYKYHKLDLSNVEKGSSQAEGSEMTTTTLGDTLLGVALPPPNSSGKQNSENNNTNNEEETGEQPILILGCGNSRFGEDMVQEGWRGPIVQTDVSRRVIEAMSHRCSELVTEGKMSFVEDDATELSAFQNDMLHGCLDKGLMDAIYCADELDQCASVLSSVNRVLRPGGVFVFFSFSRPEFLLPQVVSSERYRTSRPVWDSVEVQELSGIMLYRFQKAQKEVKKKINPSRLRKLRN